VNFGRLHVAVQRRAVHVQLLKLGIVPDFELIEELRREIEHPVSLGPELEVLRDRAGRIARRKPIPSGFNAGEAMLELNRRSGKTIFGGTQIRWKITSMRNTEKRAPKFAAAVDYFDADKVGSHVMLRHWWAGDRFQPIGRGVQVKLQEFFTNEKISLHARYQLVFDAASSGELFLVGV